MKKDNKNSEVNETDKKLNISDFMYRLFNSYKKSINWTSTLVYYIMFTIVYLMGGCTWYRFFGITGIFFIITLFVWVLYVLESENDT